METLTKRELEVLSFHEIEELQKQHFRATVRFLLPYVKAYKELFDKKGVDFSSIKSVEDWHDKGLPLLKKSYYMKNPRDFVVKVDEKEADDVYFNYAKFVSRSSGFFKKLFKKAETAKDIKDFFMLKMPLFSGGSEYGIPVPVGMTARQKQNLREVLSVASELILGNNFKGKGIVGMNLFPYGPHLGWHAVHEAFEVSAGFNLSTAAGGAIPTERIVKLANAFKANIFAGMSEYFRNRFLPEAINQKIELGKEIIFVNGADKMYGSERERIKALAKKLGANATVLDLYGASELKEGIMPECSPGAGFHNVAPLSNIIRTVKCVATDEDFIDHWEFTEPEKGGYAVAWNIDGAGTLLQGYLIGDVYGKIVREKCPKCSLNVERIFDVSRIRNAEAQLKLTGMVEGIYKGARINLVALREKILELKDVAEVQIVLKKTTREDKLIIRFAPSTKGTSAVRKVKEALKGLEFTPKIEIVSLEKLLGGEKFKFRGIVVE